jgi:SAM-dependent methyltransferase
MLRPVLSLGVMPLANALLDPNDLSRAEPRYPLDLVFCPRCTLVQITETVPPDALFREYLYFSSFSDTMLNHAKTLVDRLTAARGLNGRSLVIEIGSNDGYLLQYFAARGIPVLGIEPAENVAAVANSRGIPTRCAFFGRELAATLRGEGRGADVLLANNVLAHVADLNGVVEGIGHLLNAGGLAVIEVPYLRDMIDRCEFDTIYHEHLCYFSVTALQRLFERHSLVLADAERIPVHGGSLRLSVAHAADAGAGGRVAELLAEESVWGVDRLEAYAAFGHRAVEIKTSLVALMTALKQRGCRLAAYGAAAKGTVLLNYCRIGADVLDFVADRSPYKQGRLVPGVRVPISPPSRLIEERPDYTLLLSWNLIDEVLQQQAEYRRLGGQFIVPIPDVRIV